MFHDIKMLFGSAAMERATLFVNHVLSAEPVAARRLQPHAGRYIQLRLDSWPALLPVLAPTVFAITPAGLVEWCGDEAVAEPALRISIDASNPALSLVQALTGERPKVEISGDAGLAADLNWLFDNLRWDVQDDLSRLVGPAAARELARVGGAVARAMRSAARTLGAVAERSRGSAGQR
jgi:ubiquinone biosynthesis protein UbiJ